MQRGDSQTATVSVETVGSGEVTDIVIDDAGSNFAVRDVINFSNTGTDGTGISVRLQSLVVQSLLRLVTVQNMV